MRQGKVYWQAQYEAQRLLIARIELELSEAKDRIGELEDGMRAKTLAELRAVRPVAMPQYPDDPDEADDWGTDPTGLVREKLPPLTPEEQRYVDQLRS